MIGLLLAALAKSPVAPHATDAKVVPTVSLGKRNFPASGKPTRFRGITAPNTDAQLMRNHETNPHATVRGGYAPSTGHLEGKPISGEIEL
jgi:hypothetical protein